MANPASSCGVQLLRGPFLLCMDSDRQVRETRMRSSVRQRERRRALGAARWSFAWAHWITVVLASLASVIQAEPAAPTDAGPVSTDAQTGALDWQAFVREARGANPNLKASRQSVRGSEEALRSSEGKFFPTISGEVDTTRSASKTDHERQIVPNVFDRGTSGDSSQFHPENDFSFGLSVRQTIYDGSKEQRIVDQREAELDAAKAVALTTAAGTAFDLKSAFARTIYAEQLIGIATSAAERRKANAKLVLNRFEGGRENRGAWLKAQAVADDTEASVAVAQRALAVARRNLAQVLGRPEPVRETIKGELPTLASLETMLLYKDAPALAIKTDLSRSTPSVRQADAEVAAARAAAETARAAEIPTLSANASVARDGVTWPPDTTRVAVGLALSIPIDVSGSTRADIRAAEAESGRRQAVRDAAVGDAASALTQAASDLVDASQRIKVQSGYLEAAKVQVVIARRQYELGLVTFQEWQQTEDDEMNGERAMLADRRDALIAIAALEKALGRGLSDDGP